MVRLVVYATALAYLFGQTHWAAQAQTAVTTLPETALAPQFTPEGFFAFQSDPEFAKVKFEDWFSKIEQAQVKWTARISKPQLSIYQRLSVQVEILVSGAELLRQGWKGQLTAFVQLRDSEGRKYRDHRRLNDKTLQDVAQSQDVTCTVSALIVPGDYQVAVAIYDDATGEHAVKEERLHVAPMKSDPLPNMWRDLPAVEFVDFLDVPDQWYLPSATGRLNLTVETRQPLHIQLIVNRTPSDWLSAPSRVKNSNLSVLVAH